MAHTAPKSQKQFDQFLGQRTVAILFDDNNRVMIDYAGSTQQWDFRNDDKWHLTGMS